MPWRNRPRRALPGGAKRLRDALYAKGRLPDHAEKISVYEAIAAQVPWYSRHRHLSWCSGKEQRARARAERRRVRSAAAHAAALADLQRAMEYAASRLRWYYDNPMGPTFFEMHQWAGEATVSVGTMANAIHQLALLQASLPYWCNVRSEESMEKV